jgi:hypothetical protein
MLIIKLLLTAAYMQEHGLARCCLVNCEQRDVSQYCMWHVDNQACKYCCWDCRWACHAFHTVCHTGTGGCLLVLTSHWQVA